MKKFTLLFLFIILISCSKTKHDYSFYYWRTKLKLDTIEKEILKKSIKNLYVRLFDVDKKEGEIKVVAPLKKDKNFSSTKNIIPVVFITNRTFEFIKENQIELLANKVIHQIETLQKQLELGSSDEIQIDCDWTVGTRLDYFEFLKILKEKTKKKISVTLRLHQVKHSKSSGVPPVDCVFLMCYSTSSPLNKSDKNSILDVQLLKNYLEDIQNYPIKNIEVALPIYSWGIVENHLGKHKLINGINKKNLENPKFKKLSKNEVEILEDDFYFGHYLNKGFKIKVEEISNETLVEVVAFLDNKIENYNIVYYHLDSQFLKNRKLDL